MPQSEQFGVADLRVLLGFSDFRRLFAVRLMSQFSDGVFQVSLAAFVLFSPERQPNAGAVAAAFAVVLLPYTVLGPFCGVLLDRWSRRQVLLWANLLRALMLLLIAGVMSVATGPLFYLLVLAVFGVNRFLLAGLSAGLPHVVPGDRLVAANAISPTCGTVAYLAGLGAGSAVQLSGGNEVAVLLFGAIGCGCAGLLALRMPRALLGPDQPARVDLRTAVLDTLRGLRDGARHLGERRRAAAALAVIGAHRFGFGVTTVAAVLLFRNYFDPAAPDAGMVGMAGTVLASGAGLAIAALATPAAASRFGSTRWIVTLLVLAGVVQLFPGMLFTETAVLATAFVLGIASQGIKICVDAIVQREIDDLYRGRVFTFYDTVFNLLFVAAVSFAAVTLPETGRSFAVLTFVAACYLLTALAYRRVPSLGGRRGS